MTSKAVRRRRLIAYGRWESPKVDPTRAREHIKELREWGLSIDAISHLAGLAEGMVESLYFEGKSNYRTWIRPETERAILAAAFDLDDLLPSHQVDACGTQRRIRALSRIGWSQTYLSSRLGLSSAAVGIALRPERRYVTVATARRTRDLYQELQLKLGPSVHTMGRAAKAGWPPPWAWDDDTIDHPATQPDLSCLVPEDKARCRPAEEVFEDAQWLLEHNPYMTKEEAAERLSTTKDAISHMLNRVWTYRTEAAYGKLRGPLTEEEQASLDAALAPVEAMRFRFQDNAERVYGRRGNYDRGVAS